MSEMPVASVKNKEKLLVYIYNSFGIGMLIGLDPDSLIETLIAIDEIGPGLVLFSVPCTRPRPEADRLAALLDLPAAAHQRRANKKMRKAENLFWHSLSTNNINDVDIYVRCHSKNQMNQLFRPSVPEELEEDEHANVTIVVVENFNALTLDPVYSHQIPKFDMTLSVYENKRIYHQRKKFSYEKFKAKNLVTKR